MFDTTWKTFAVNHQSVSCAELDELQPGAKIIKWVILL